MREETQRDTERQNLEDFNLGRRDRGRDGHETTGPNLDNRLASWRVEGRTWVISFVHRQNGPGGFQMSEGTQVEVPRKQETLASIDPGCTACSASLYLCS
jgi:hypothetical protein